MPWGLTDIPQCSLVLGRWIGVGPVGGGCRLLSPAERRENEGRMLHSGFCSEAAFLVSYVM